MLTAARREPGDDDAGASRGIDTKEIDKKVVRLRPNLGVYPARFVLIPLGAQLTGLSEKAIRRKIEDGVWREGREWKRGPDNRLYLDMEGYAKWVSKG